MMAMVASPTPNPTSTKTHNHPPYKEMIVSAIEFLKESNGSSKRAIMKYIAANFNDLPSAHDALLSYHLSHLKEEGVLQMVQRSYKVANLDKTLHIAENGGDPAFNNLKLLSQVSAPNKRGRPPSKSILPGIEKKKRGRPRKIWTQEGTYLPSGKRKPGRTPKILSGPELILPNMTKLVMVNIGQRKPVRPPKMPLGERRKPGRPKKGSSLSIPKLAAVLPTGNKRKRGRPKKSSSSFNPIPAILSSDEKRKRGRPKKSSSSFNPVPAISSSGEKRKPGRPNKSSSSFNLIPAISSLGEKRKQGRPKKSSSAFDQNAAPILSSGEKQNRGRPKKISSPFKQNITSNLSLGEKRKRGRPKKSSSPFTQNISSIFSLGEKRKPGRPKKGSETPKLATPLTSGERRKQGRPKKFSAPMESSMMAATPQAPATIGEKRKRGRPKKSSEVKTDGHEQPQREPAAPDKSLI